MAQVVEDMCLGYKTFITDISSTLFKYLEHPHGNYSYPLDFLTDLKQYGSFTSFDISVVVVSALICSVVRYALTAFILAPWARWLQLTKDNEDKFPESAWKTMHYGFTWTYSAYLLFGPGKYDYFFKPEYMFLDWKAKQDAAMDIYVLHMIELGFYVHSVYGTLYLDHWRKDSNVMVFHHLLSILLLVFSYAVRYHKVVIIMIFLHDLADVVLEFTKCNVYVKNRGGKPHPLNNHIATVGFLCFATVWYVGRLFWYPLKVLHVAGHHSMYHSPMEFDMPFYIIFNVLMWVILGLNLYWFMYILSFLYRVATGQIKEVDDVREDCVIERMNKGKFVTNGKPHINGTNGTKVTKKQRMKKD